MICNAHKVENRTSNLRSPLHVWLLWYKKFAHGRMLLRRNDLAAASIVFFAPDIQKLADSWDKCLNEFRRRVEKTIMFDV